MPRKLFQALAAALLCIALPALSQNFVPKSIQFTGDPEYSNDELLAASGLKIGVVLTNAQMNDVAKRLMDTGLFAGLAFKFDGQDLTFQLTPANQIVPICLTNLPLITVPQLDAKLRPQFPLYHGKLPSEGGLTESVRATLEEMLAAQGIKATLLASPIADQKTGKIVAVGFSITSPPVMVGDIHSENTDPLDPKVLPILARLSGSSYDVDGSPEQIDTNIRVYYQDLGYLEAAIHAEPSAAPIISPDAIRIPFSVSITPGIRYKVTAITLAPGLVVSQADFDRQSQMHPGDPAGGEHIRANWLYLERQYHNHGFIRAKIDATPTLDRANGTVSYVATVVPGPAYKMGTLNIENVSDELRSMILAAWKMPAGAVFNEGAILGFFASYAVNPKLERVFATVDVKYVMRPNEDTHTVDLTLRLERKH
jgi:outer membrane protein insertion porin family